MADTWLQLALRSSDHQAVTSRYLNSAFTVPQVAVATPLVPLFGW